MRYFYSLLAIFYFLVNGEYTYSQSFTYLLTGNPVNTTGWTMGGGSSVSGDAIVLTNPMQTQSGYIYYSTPQNLANCSQFTVSFEFRVTNSSNPTADGFSFWYISNPPAGFQNGGGMGLPNNPDGLILLLDTYNNNGLPNDNPLVSLRRFTGNTNYVEGSATGLLTPDVTYQNFITDGNWHTCTLHYSFGTVSVSFDGNPPIMSGNTTLSLNGYFGFSASTGSYYANHSIKNVAISGAHEPDPPATTPVTYCLNEPAVPLTAPGSNLLWYTSATGGSPLPGAPTPSTSTAGTFTWYVSEEIPGCNIESARAPLVVTVLPLPEYDRNVTICEGATYNFYGTPLTIPGDYEAIRPANDGSCDSLIKLYLNLNVLPTPIINPSRDVTLCYGDVIKLSVSNPNVAFTYQWKRNGINISGATGTEYIIDAPGKYSVTITSNDCRKTSEETKVAILPKTVAQIFTPEKDDFCAGDTLSLQAEEGEGYEYLWKPELPFLLMGDNKSAHVSGIFTQPQTEVTLTVKDKNGCAKETSLIVTTHSCCHIFIPSAFSPNNDGLNDYFIPSMGVGQFLNELWIYDRYGKLLYGNKINPKGWNGTYNGQDVAAGVYMYYLKYTCADGNVFFEKGDITLIR